MADAPRLNLAQALRTPFQALVAELHQRLDAAGYGDIRPVHTALFAHLDPSGEPMRLGELAARAQLTKQMLNHIVTAMEESGYLERLPDPQDGRGRLVRLTPRGMEASRAGRAIISAIEAEWTAALGEQEIAGLRRSLEALVAWLTEPEP